MLWYARRTSAARCTSLADRADRSNQQPCTGVYFVRRIATQQEQVPSIAQLLPRLSRRTNVTANTCLCAGRQRGGNPARQISHGPQRVTWVVDPAPVAARLSSADPRADGKAARAGASVRDPNPPDPDLATRCMLPPASRAGPHISQSIRAQSRPARATRSNSNPED